MVRTLRGHGHWVNALALSSEHALRTGPFDHHGRAPADLKAAKEARSDNAMSHTCVRRRLRITAVGFCSSHYHQLGSGLQVDASCQRQRLEPFMLKVEHSNRHAGGTRAV